MFCFLFFVFVFCFCFFCFCFLFSGECEVLLTRSLWIQPSIASGKQLIKLFFSLCLPQQVSDAPMWSDFCAGDRFYLTSVLVRGTYQGSVSWRPTTVKRRQFSQSNRHSTIGTRQTEYHEVLPSSANVQSHLTSSFTDDGNAS